LPCHLEWRVWNRTNTTCCCCFERMPWAHFIQDCVSLSKGSTMNHENSRWLLITRFPRSAVNSYYYYPQRK
jgi:hypothetical protein